MRTDVLIVGAGPAGLAAAIAVKESGLNDILVVEREQEAGGILRQCIHNGFGLHRFQEELTGPEYAKRDIDVLRDLDVTIWTGTTVLSVSPDKKVTLISPEHGFQVVECGAVILCMGCRERPRGALGTPGTRCAGIFSAGTAQKFVNMDGYMPGRRIVVLGSGDIGLIMARRMTLQGANVLACVEIMPYSSGLNRNIVQCLDDYQIPLLLNHTVTRVEGRDRLTGVTVSRVESNRRPIKGTEIDFACDTLLLSVGLIPENELTKGAGITLSDVTGGAIVNDRFETDMEGIFTAGNVLHVHDLVDYVSDEAAKAGRAAADYVKYGSRTVCSVHVIDGKGIRGAVPQRICLPVTDDIKLMFRPDNVYENVYLYVTADSRTLVRRKHRILTPGEMAEVVIAKDKLADLQGNVTVSIGEVPV